MEITQNDKCFLISLGKVIKRLREEKGLSQEKLSYEVDVSRNQISLIECGDTNPTILVLKRIAEVLDVNVSELL